jgi:hypothetical protein
MPSQFASIDSTSAWPNGRHHLTGKDRCAGSGRTGDTSPAARGAQRLQALRRANEVRLARAAVKRMIAAGEMSVVEAILSESSEISRMAVSELLLSQRSWGDARCRGLLMSVPLSETKTVGSMTPRQRSLLTALLTDGM